MQNKALPAAVVLALAIGGLILPAQAQTNKYHGLVCRGVEESGRLFIGQPGFGPHLVSLFVTGPNPLSASETISQHVAWVIDPAHSYVRDGTGAMCIWAHPHGIKPPAILALRGLSGFELNYAGNGTEFDQLADGVWRGCVAAGRPFLWGYAADDTHASGPKGLSWFSARLPAMTEEALKHALRSGAFYVSNGPVISNISVTATRITVELPQPGDVCWLRAGQFFSSEKDEPISVEVTKTPGRNHCLQIDRGVRTATLDLARAGVPVGDVQFVRAIILAPPDKIAQTEPFRVLPDGKIVNPYPATGAWIRGQTHNHSDTPPWSTTGLQRFRLGYQEQGELAAFCTDYSYWESPYQWAPADGTPQVLSLTPAHLKADQEGTLTINGVNFGAAPQVHIGQAEARVLKSADKQVTAQAPAGLKPGQYDVIVDNARFRGTLPLAFTIQQPDAADAGWKSYTVADGLAYPHCLSIACRQGEVWVGAIDGLSRFCDGQWEKLGTEVGGHSIYAIAADPDGSMWVATERGLSHYGRDGKWTREVVGQTEKLAKGLSSERWGRMIFDHQGTLWAVNRWRAGLGVRRRGKWQRLTTADGIPTNSPITITCDKSGTVWLGHYGLDKLAGGKWEKVALPKAASGATVAALAPLPDGSVLAAINSAPDQGCLVRFNRGKSEVIPLSETAIPSPRIRDILVSRAGDTWFATDYGLTRWDSRGHWRHFNTVNSGLGCNIVLRLAEDDQGRIWLATAEGVSCYDPAAQ